ncbi:MAG: GTP-binding protein [Anaerolineales bacterium]|nr:GTP-binding protein [Anaerolineales bacterium]
MGSITRSLARKVCLLGDFAVGKTSLVRHFVEGRFDERYLSTIGVKVDRKVLYIPASSGTLQLTLMLWDLAGGPERSSMAPSYYRGAAAAIIACDLTRPETLSGLAVYAQEFLAVNPSARIVMAANKVDLVDDRRVSDDDLATAASEHDAPLFLTSAKTGERVDAMFQHLGVLLISEHSPQIIP